MWHSLEAIMMATLFFTCAKCSPERKTALKELWQHIKQQDKSLYKKLKYFSYATPFNCMTWKVRGCILTRGYKFLCKKIKLG